MATSARWPLKTKLSLNQLSVVDGLDQITKDRPGITPRRLISI